MHVIGFARARRDRTAACPMRLCPTPRRRMYIAAPAPRSDVGYPVPYIVIMHQGETSLLYMLHVPMPTPLVLVLAA